MGNFFEDIGNGIGSIVNSGVNTITGLAGNALGNLTGQNSAMQMSEEQFNKQLEWEKEKFHTAHQAEMEDLKAAGLNPVLTATGGNGNSAGSLTPTHTTTASNQSMVQLLTSIFPAVAQMKQANAANTTANALAGKYGAEADYFKSRQAVEDIEKLLKNKDLETYEKRAAYNNSKSPLWLYEKFEDLFNKGSSSMAANKVENLTMDIYDFVESPTGKFLIKNANNMTPNGQIKQILKMLYKLLV